MSDALFLCATTRLAQTLRGELPAGAAVWRTRQALTLGQWLATLADEALLCGLDDLPTALDPLAERLLWERVIESSLSDAAPLFDLPGMAASAAEAHALCRIWGLQPGGEILAEEARLFLGWQKRFVQRCASAGWIDLAGLHLRLLDLIEAGHFALPERMVFAGFDRLTPLETRLQAVLAGRGVRVDGWLPDAASGAAPVVHACADSAAECAAVVAWAVAKRAADPGLRLGIVAPNLAGVRERLEFMLDDALHPDLIRPDGAELPRCFNFSLGRPLAELPLVRSGLELLALGSGRARVEQQRFSSLLLAGAWSAVLAEADGRARFDLHLRRELPYFTSLQGVLRLGERLAGQGDNDCPQSLAALAALAEVFAGQAKKCLPSLWAGVFRQALQAAGWPGERPLSSHEYQAHRAFGEVLDGFGRLDEVLGPVNHGEALRRLREACRQRIFQPETLGRPAIQVLGVLESAGLQFDALWVMGMNDDQWPPAPRPNPLLPAELLRKAGASHASAEVELDFARRVHARLLAASPEIHFSFARADGNRVLRPSPLIAGLSASADELPAVPGLAASIFDGTALEAVEDWQAPPVAPGEKVSGGSWLLRAQAICPAWAYFQFRLGAEAMEEAVEGLDPAARGTLVHAALEHFWLGVRSSSALLDLTPEARARAIAVAVAEAVADFEGERRIALPARFRELEAARLERLLALWLEVEAGRGSRFEVLACEQSAEVDIEGIRVRMVVDRIDRLDDGRRVIIDYKTGAAIDIRNWAGPRLTEPQLPIYAALLGEGVAAVVFAKVLPDKPAFAGVADEKDLLPGVQGIGDEKQKIFDVARFPDWQSLVTHWHDSLHAVAREVKAGFAPVAVSDARALQYCEVLPLLRLAEQQAWRERESQGAVPD